MLGVSKERPAAEGQTLVTHRSSVALLLVIPWKAGLQLEFITTVKLVGKLENIAPTTQAWESN